MTSGSSNFFLDEAIRAEGMSLGTNNFNNEIMMAPPTNSANANCHPMRIHRTRPSSITKLVLANIKIIEVVKSAPLEKRLFANALAA